MHHNLERECSLKIKGVIQLTAKNNRFGWLLILLLSVASVRRKLLRTTYTEERCVNTNSEIRILQLSKRVWTLHSSVGRF